jgi:hypothetical protein
VGESKADNTLITASGPVPVDRDTVRLAPPARDIWMTEAVNNHTAVTGRQSQLSIDALPVVDGLEFLLIILRAVRNPVELPASRAGDKAAGAGRSPKWAGGTPW